MSFITYIKEGKFAKTNAMIVTALKEKTLSLIESEKLRVAAGLFEEWEGLNEAKASPIHPLHNLALKHGYEYKGQGLTTKSNLGDVHRHNYVHSSGHKLELGSTTKKGELQHFWSHESKGGRHLHHGISSVVEPKKLKYSLNKHLGKNAMNEAEVQEASPAMAPAKPFSVPKKSAAQPKAPAVAGKTGKWGKWSDNKEDRMPYDYSNYGNHPGARKSAIADFSESETSLTQSHIDASYQKVLKAKRAHERAANAGYGKRTNTPGAMNDKDSNIRRLQDAHHAAAVAHKALVKRFETQGGKK
jgi:hypothetical protein